MIPKGNKFVQKPNRTQQNRNSTKLPEGLETAKYPCAQFAAGTDIKEFRQTQSQSGRPI